MSYKISKELFEAVRKDINGVVSIDCTKQEIDNYFRVNYKNNFGLFHYDEFFFKCKKWALEQGYNLVSCINKCHIQRKEVSMDMHIQTVMADSEQQSLFDACQWILEKKDKQ